MGTNKYAENRRYLGNSGIRKGIPSLSTIIRVNKSFEYVSGCWKCCKNPRDEPQVAPIHQERKNEISIFN